MVTKTLTITEGTYDLLKTHKREGESFSQEITRVFAKEQTRIALKDFFGILPESTAENIKRTLDEHNTWEKNQTKKRMNELWKK